MCFMSSIWDSAKNYVEQLEDTTFTEAVGESTIAIKIESLLFTQVTQVI